MAQVDSLSRNKQECTAHLDMSAPIADRVAGQTSVLSCNHGPFLMWCLACRNRLAVFCLKYRTAIIVDLALSIHLAMNILAPSTPSRVCEESQSHEIPKGLPGKHHQNTFIFRQERSATRNRIDQNAQLVSLCQINNGRAKIEAIQSQWSDTT